VTIEDPKVFTRPWEMRLVLYRHKEPNFQLLEYECSAFDVEDFFAKVAEKREQIRTSEDVVVSKVGRELYEKFFRNYSRKAWGLDPSELDAQVTARVPTRTNRRLGLRPYSLQSAV